MSNCCGVFICLCHCRTAPYSVHFSSHRFWYSQDSSYAWWMRHQYSTGCFTYRFWNMPLRAPPWPYLVSIARKWNAMNCSACIEYRRNSWKWSTCTMVTSSQLALFCWAWSCCCASCRSLWSTYDWNGAGDKSLDNILLIKGIFNSPSRICVYTHTNNNRNKQLK